VIGTIEFPSILFVNEFSAPNEATKLRWVMLSPFGDWPNQQGLQRIQKQDADNIVQSFNSITNIAHKTIGLPFFIGHPDHPAFSDRYKDGKAYGRIKTLEARNDGLWAGVRFGAEGEKLISDEAFHGHSVNWFLKEDPNAKGVWRPFKLKSVGFTNEPNIPVPPVTTANESDYKNSDGSFKGGFDGCVAYMQTDSGGGHDEDSAKKICGKIAADQSVNEKRFLTVAMLRHFGNVMSEAGEDPAEEATESPTQESAEMTAEDAQKRLDNGNASLRTARAYDLNTNPEQAQQAYADARGHFQAILNSPHSQFHPEAQAGMSDIQNTTSPYSRDLAMAQMRNPKTHGEKLAAVLP
jgi:hypothetical protein